MARKKWSREAIIDQIRAYHRAGEKLTNSDMKEKDSRLVGAAVSYFGNWGNAVRAAGLDYGKVRAISRNQRAENYRKWTEERVLDEIRRVAVLEQDISYVFMKEKYSSLVAAANNYFGSWKKAIEQLGYNYIEVQKKGRVNRNQRDKFWRRRLLLERLSQLPQRDERLLREVYPKFHKVLMDHFGSWEKVGEALRETANAESP